MVKTSGSTDNQITGGEKNLPSNSSYQTIGVNPNQESKLYQNYNNQDKLSPFYLLFSSVMMLFSGFLVLRYLWSKIRKRKKIKNQKFEKHKNKSSYQPLSLQNQKEMIKKGLVINKTTEMLAMRSAPTDIMGSQPAAQFSVVQLATPRIMQRSIYRKSKGNLPAGWQGLVRRGLVRQGLLRRPLLKQGVAQSLGGEITPKSKEFTPDMKLYSTFGLTLLTLDEIIKDISIDFSTDTIIDISTEAEARAALSENVEALREFADMILEAIDIGAVDVREIIDSNKSVLETAFKPKFVSQMGKTAQKMDRLVYYLGYWTSAGVLLPDLTGVSTFFALGKYNIKFLQALNADKEFKKKLEEITKERLEEITKKDQQKRNPDPEMYVDKIEYINLARFLQYLTFSATYQIDHIAISAWRAIFQDYTNPEYQKGESTDYYLSVYIMPALNKARTEGGTMTMNLPYTPNLRLGECLENSFNNGLLSDKFLETLISGYGFTMDKCKGLIGNMLFASRYHTITTVQKWLDRNGIPEEYEVPLFDLFTYFNRLHQFLIEIQHNNGDFWIVRTKEDEKTKENKKTKGDKKTKKDKKTEKDKKTKKDKKTEKDKKTKAKNREQELFTEEHYTSEHIKQMLEYAAETVSSFNFILKDLSRIKNVERILQIIDHKWKELLDVVDEINFDSLMPNQRTGDPESLSTQEWKSSLKNERKPFTGLISVSWGVKSEDEINIELTAVLDLLQTWRVGGNLNSFHLKTFEKRWPLINIMNPVNIMNPASEDDIIDPDSEDDIMDPDSEDDIMDPDSEDDIMDPDSEDV